METPQVCETKPNEFLVRKIENESSSLDTTEENHQVNDDVGLIKKNKRKKSTSSEGITVENEPIDVTNVDYEIVQHENKRQKIEILKSEEIDEKLNLDKSSVDAIKPKDAKNHTETNKLRLKYENIHTNTVQKLNAQAEQLRIEISTLRTALANEQNAVRALR